jgi:hypothetical protein
MKFDVPNFFAIGDEAYQNGRQRAQQRGVQNALAQAEGDPAGAQNELIRYGATDQANALAARQRQQVAEAAETATLARRKTLGAQAAGGDIPGAQKAALSAGDTEFNGALQKLSDQQLAEHDRKMNIVGGFLSTLADVPLAERQALVKQYAGPLSQQTGLTPEQIAAYPLDDNGLKIGITQAVGYTKASEMEKARREGQGEGVVVDGVLVNKLTGKPMYAPEKIEHVPVTDDVYRRPGIGGATSSAARAPSADAPRGLRNNNPLNLRPLANGQWDGQTGVDDGNYAKFGSEQDGWNAAHKNLQAYGSKHGINTVAGVINRWAPAGDNNQPQVYAATVANALGVAPEAPINLQDAATREKLLTAMSQVELGRPYAGPAAQPSSGRPGGFELIRKGEAKDDNELELSPDITQQLAETFITTGQMPALGTRAGPARQAILNKVGEIRKAGGIDGYKAAEDQASYRANRSALTQVSRQLNMVQSFEKTAIKNADLALALAPKGSGPTGSPVLNRWIQHGRKSIAGDADVAAFDVAVGTFADEYAKIVTGSTGAAGSTDSARAEAYRRINGAMSPAQLRSVISTMKLEMGNRMDSLHEQEASLRTTLSANPGAPKAAAPAVKADPLGLR